MVIKWCEACTAWIPSFIFLWGEIRAQIKTWDCLRNFPLCAFGPGLAKGYGFFKSGVVMVSYIYT